MGRRARERGWVVGTVMFCALLGWAAVGAMPAKAAPPPLWTKCTTGSGAGQCSFPRGIAANPRNGHIFVADQGNRRIDELNALGQFIRAWGWGVLDGGDETQVCSGASGCQSGATGSQAGEFGSPQGVAVDSAGNVYVFDRGLSPANQRVQKFDPEGHFLLTFGGEVNKTKSEEVGSSEEERNLCPFEAGDECQGGTIGTGDGQFGETPATGNYVAIDTKGTATSADDRVYVGDVERIEVFDTGGHYLESIPLPIAGRAVKALAVDSSGSLYVAYFNQEGIHELNGSGAEVREFEPPLLSPFESAFPIAVAVDSEGQVVAFLESFGGNGPRNPIVEFDQSGKVIDEWGKGEFAASTGLATNLCAESEPPGDVYLSNPSSSEAFLRAYGTDPIGCFKARTGQASEIEEHAATLNGTVNPTGLAVSECRFEYGADTGYGQSAPCAESGGEIGAGTAPVPVHADISGLAKGTVYHFRLVAKVGSETETGADEEFKTLGPPVISGEHATNVGYGEATLKALVNPEGFATSYRFHYTSLSDYEAEGFAGAQSTPQISVGEDRSAHAVSASLGGLVPGTAYAWRAVAQNASGTSEGEDRQFVTYRTPEPETDCPEQAYRSGASSLLPDCRAYEMVSPADKNGGDVFSALDGSEHPGGYTQAAPEGAKISYTVSLSSFAGQQSSLDLNQYLAVRTERGEPGEGWSNEGIHPPVTGSECCSGSDIFGLHRDFTAFSPDLCSAWLVDHQEPPLTADAQAGYPNLYRRSDCGGGVGSLEALVPDPPALPPGTPQGYVSNESVQGVSEDGGEVVFTAEAKLTGDASEALTIEGEPVAQVYERSGGEIHLVSVLPGGAGASGETSEVGSRVNLERAVSRDGSRVYWSTGPNAGIGAGRIYVRLNPDREQSALPGGKCSEAAKACTLAVSKGALPTFWAAAADGSKALYSEGDVHEGEGELFEYDLAKAQEGLTPQRLIARHVLGAAGTSAGLGRIYFASSDALGGAGENSQGDSAQAGKPNLYLAEGSTLRFVATLAAGDAGALEPKTSIRPYDVVGEIPYRRATRVSADGSAIAFDSRARLTSFDNTDAASGRPDVEVYRYEAGGALSCVSCAPSGAAPEGMAEMRMPYSPSFVSEGKTGVFAAAWIPTWEHPLHAPNVLSADGGRLFFNSVQDLVPQDSNHAQDVYEWERPGKGRCSEGSPSYFPQSGGCLYLISSGESPLDSEFWEATPEGSDVFFTTASSLVAGDPGLLDLYDARVDGGFPAPEGQAECEGEACQSPPPPPAFQTPSSATYSAPAAGRAKPRKCPKGRRRVRRHGRLRCLKRRRAHHHRHRRHHRRRAHRGGSRARAGR